jgi:pyruvate dehydrogenase E1 component
MSSFIAAGTAYASHGINMIPFFIYYSMFGFQRIGDFIWAAADARAKGFLLGGTAGRTTLNGEGLQHQDGHSLLFSMAFPTVRSYDPTYSYEIAIIVIDGLRRMYQEGEDAMYYITLENENYPMPAMPPGVEEGVIKGMYKLSTVDAGPNSPKVQLLGSGAILREALRAQKILAEKYNVSSSAWSVTSYRELRREAQACERWNLLHPTEKPRTSYLEDLLVNEKGPFIASSDYVRAVSEQISPWVPGGLYALGTDGLGRSDLRPRLRRHFEVDAEMIVITSLRQLAREGKFTLEQVAQAIKDLGIDTEKIDPVTA